MGVAPRLRSKTLLDQWGGLLTNAWGEKDGEDGKKRKKLGPFRKQCEINGGENQHNNGDERDVHSLS